MIRYIKKLLTGQIYRSNKLIGTNISMLLQRVSILEEYSLAKKWITTLGVSSHILLSDLIFEKKTFKFGLSLNNLDTLRVLSLIRLIATYYLIAFTNNKDINTIFDRINTTVDEFKSKIFELLDFSAEDSANYEILDSLYLNNNLEFGTIIYTLFWKQGYLIDPEVNNFYVVTGFSALLSNHYRHVFVSDLSKAFHDNQIQYI